MQSKYVLYTTTKNSERNLIISYGPIRTVVEDSSLAFAVVAVVWSTCNQEICIAVLVTEQYIVCVN